MNRRAYLIPLIVAVTLGIIGFILGAYLPPAHEGINTISNLLYVLGALLMGYAVGVKNGNRTKQNP